MTTTAKESLLKQSGGRCIYCGHELTVANMTVDHIIPKSAGGTDAESNLIACCKECNAKKADQALGVFLLQKTASKRTAYLNRLNALFNGKKISAEKVWLLQGNPPMQASEPVEAQRDLFQDSEEMQFIVKAMKLEEELWRHLWEGQAHFGGPDPSVVLEPLRCSLKDMLYDGLMGFLLQQERKSDEKLPQIFHI